MKLTLIITILSLSILKCYAPNSKEKTYKNTKVLLLMETIAKVETGDDNTKMGKSGERGKYQILKGTWKDWCKKYHGEELEFTLENQNYLVYKVLEDWDKKYTVDQIASKWNSGQIFYQGKIGINKHGVKYDVPKYVNKFLKQWNTITSQYQPAMVELSFMSSNNVN